MGDVGSLVLGFAVASLLVYGVGSGAFELPVGLMVSALFLVDATLTLARRVLRGERWYNAHRQHLYQRLIAAGWTHGRVLALYQALNLLLAVCDDDTKVIPAQLYGTRQSTAAAGQGGGRIDGDDTHHQPARQPPRGGREPRRHGRAGLLGERTA